eukprot:GFYU01000249.1.p1 GENE.GFYU01000249.1~~GFYU01000249.1.p1  ORF type:complete len:152 (+),score=26.42 GFYU01000249.1:63-518(+)
MSLRATVLNMLVIGFFILSHITYMAEKTGPVKSVVDFEVLHKNKGVETFIQSTNKWVKKFPMVHEISVVSGLAFSLGEYALLFYSVLTLFTTYVSKTLSAAINVVFYILVLPLMGLMLLSAVADSNSVPPALSSLAATLASPFSGLASNFK